jgi:hypothetical protein
LLDASAKSLRRPYGTWEEIFDFVFPTLKRGANIHCAYGAGTLI